MVSKVVIAMVLVSLSLAATGVDSYRCYCTEEGIIDETWIEHMKNDNYTECRNEVSDSHECMTIKGTHIEYGELTLRTDKGNASTCDKTFETPADVDFSEYVRRILANWSFQLYMTTGKTACCDSDLCNSASTSALSFLLAVVASVMVYLNQ